MRTPVDARLTEEAARFAFRFACDDCVHFAPEREPGRSCGNGWPLRLRRSATEPASLPLGKAPAEDEGLSFCKEFELA